MNFETNGWGQPPGLGGNNHVPSELGFIVSEDYYNKIKARVDAAETTVAQAESGKRISSFQEGPFNNRFFQPPINDSDAYASVAYWMAVAAMATGNKKVLTAASKYAESADRYSLPFLRMKTGGIAQIYRGGGAALRRNAGNDANNPTVKYAAGIFAAQGDPQRFQAARKRAQESDPAQIVYDAGKKTLTETPDARRIPWWGYAIAGTAILGVVLYFTAGSRARETAGKIIRRGRRN